MRKGKVAGAELRIPGAQVHWTVGQRCEHLGRGAVTEGSTTSEPSSLSAGPQVKDSIDKQRVLARRVSGGQDPKTRTNLDRDFDKCDDEPELIPADDPMEPAAPPQREASSAGRRIDGGVEEPWVCWKGAWSSIERKMETQTSQTERMFGLKAERMNSLEARLEQEAAKSREAMNAMHEQLDRDWVKLCEDRQRRTSTASGSG